MASLNVSMPDGMREYVDERTEEGNFGTPTEYIRSLVRQDQQVREKQLLEKKLLEALDDDRVEEVTPEFFERLRAFATEKVG